MEGQYGSIEPMWDTKKETTLVNHAAIPDPCSKIVLFEHHEKMTQEATQKLKGKEVQGQYGSTSKETPLVSMHRSEILAPRMLSHRIS